MLNKWSICRIRTHFIRPSFEQMDCGESWIAAKLSNLTNRLAGAKPMAWFLRFR
jgi:hypothetical protein